MRPAETDKGNRRMGRESVQNIRAGERLIYGGEEDRRVRKAGTENKTVNRYIGKKGEGDYTGHGVIGLRRELT